ncbi:facilitated trehalose transporter Tret1 [Drosophila grimshawi]|uniref:GH11269 n=1 Tax=Drosophila grimshawi TaxID=7222 RepID=B4JDX9_DROGR|nr:facilitated trehalose transporter Tret1 [Drosophila grimshawi]EDW03499.1 GH11269 [Drosophila grimshawi]
MGANYLKLSNCLLNKRNRSQLFGTVIINIICISHGIGIGWLSPTLRKLQSTDTPLNIPISINEISWVDSALCLGSVTGNVFAGLLLNRIGSKMCLLLMAVPHTCLWLLVYFAKSVDYLIIGRYLAGITGGGIYLIHPLFISEISDAHIRGTLASMVMLSINIGILIGYILGTRLAYHLVPLIVVVCPICYFILVLLFIRDSPTHLIRKGKIMAAEQSFRYYKNIKGERDYLIKLAMVEFNYIKASLTNEDNVPHEVVLKDFFTREAIKGYGMAAVIIIANQFSALFVMINYMSDIFANSGSTMDPNTSTIIIGSVQILGAFVGTVLYDIFGRKALMVVSTGGVALSLAAFGFFTHFTGIYDFTAWSWVPVAIMAIDIFLGNIGLISCLFVLMVEMFPLKIRNTATSIAIVICSSLVFLILNIFPLCMAGWGLPATLWSCAAITAICFLCFLFFLRETKGKSMLEN